MLLIMDSNNLNKTTNLGLKIIDHLNRDRN